MKVTQLENFIERIHQIQFLMISVSAKVEDIKNVEREYVSLYNEIILDIEIFQEEDILIIHSNEFLSLWSWYKYWKENLIDYASRFQYIYDLYINIIKVIEPILQDLYNHNHFGNDANKAINPEVLKSLVERVDQLQDLMMNVANSYDRTKLEYDNYSKLYQEISSSIYQLQQVGLSCKNPNKFISLWYWYSYSKLKLEGKDEYRRFLRELYSAIISPVQKSL